MTILLALALAAAPNSTGPAMNAWGRCTGTYVGSHLRSGSAEQIADAALRACRTWEDAAQKAWDHKAGPTMFVGIRHRVRQLLLRRIAEAQRQRGIC